jgi:hypothetical protein
LAFAAVDESRDADSVRGRRAAGSRRAIRRQEFKEQFFAPLDQNEVYYQLYLGQPISPFRGSSGIPFSRESGDLDEIDETSGLSLSPIASHLRAITGADARADARPAPTYCHLRL